MTPDQITELIRDLAVASSRLDDHKTDIDELAKNQRRGNEELRAAIDSAVAGIGRRIEGFDAACGKKVDALEHSIEEDFEELRKEVRGRRWSRVEILAFAMPTFTTIATLLVTVFLR